MRHKMEDWRDWQIALAITAALRVFYSAWAVGFAFLVQPDPALIHSNALTENLPPSGGWHYAAFGIWQRFDTLWYLRIAERGYDLPAAVVFYPLYPGLIRVLSAFMQPMVAALTVSTTAAFFAFYGLLSLVRTESPPSQRLRAITLVAVWPASFFFFGGYTEALAVALIVWSIAWARKEHWVPAVGCALAAGLTRSAGTLLIVPLAIMAWRSRRHGRWLVLLSPAGTITYWLWLHYTGRLSVAEAYRIYWGTQVAAPWTTLGHAILSQFRQFDALVAISLLMLALFFAAGVLAPRRTEDRWFSAAVMGHLLLRVFSPPLMGAPRYLLPVYPAFLTFGEWAGKMNALRFGFLCAALFAFNLVWMWSFLKWSLVL